jgi:hypothetical protein
LVDYEEDQEEVPEQPESAFWVKKPFGGCFFVATGVEKYFFANGLKLCKDLIFRIGRVLHRALEDIPCEDKPRVPPLDEIRLHY